MDNWIYTSDNDIPFIDSNNKKFFTKSIAENVSIFLDNNERESEKHIDFYNLVEKLETLENSDDNEIFFYSFALNNTLDQPYGHINLSGFNNLEFRLRLKDPSQINKLYAYNLGVYINYYNVIVYNNGTAGFKYAN